MRKWAVPSVLLLVLAALCFADSKDEHPKPARSIEELRQQLEKVLRDTHTPGASVAIVRREGPEWVAGLGLADVAPNRAATSATLFRIGSTSKAFAAMSILLLAGQGKLSLDDPVHKLAPEVWFENRWEASDPVRVVHVLEHTAGWEDLHLREFALDAPPSMGLREALDYDHHSRISRWRPGTRMAYCNSGPAVAAYIVEKLTHQRFEDFVEQNLFRPIGMHTATYFPPPAGTATVLYHSDGKTPFPYWNIIYRPAGSINASAQDMAAYLQFYLNRGMVNGVQVVPSADIARMEIPASTWAAKQGLRAGYGLSNYWTVSDGYVYHGHNGGVSGGLTELAYMPDYGVGYFFSINSGSQAAYDRMAKAIRAYVTSNLQKPSLPPMAPLPADAAQYAGWYEPDAPRMELSHFLERLMAISRVRFQNGKLLLTSLGGWNQVYLPVAGEQFRHVPKKDAPDPVATLVLLTPSEGDQYLQGFSTSRRIPAWLAVGEIVLTIFALLSILSIVVYAPFWILGGISKKRRRPAERALRIWPLVAALSMVAVVLIFVFGSEDAIALLGRPTAWSGTLFLATLVFALASVASAIAVWRAAGGEVRRGVRTYSIVVTVALLVVTAYLAYWGMIGLRTWA